LVGAVVIIQGLALGELIERRRRPGEAPPTDWYAWTLVGLTWLVALTYFFACLHKLNQDWLSPDGSAAPAVLLASVEPLLVPLAGSPERALAIVAGPAIYSTLALELVLPILLFGRRTRLLGCLVGIGFHLPMLVQRVGDFPVLILAFYPLFLSAPEAQAVLARCLERPSPARLASGLALGAALVALSARSEPLKQLAIDTDPLVLLLRDLLLFGSLILFAWIVVVLAGLLIERAFARLRQGQESGVRSRESGVKFAIPDS
jgi:hypothetical protein